MAAGQGLFILPNKVEMLAQMKRRYGGAQPSTHNLASGLSLHS